eukprot:SM000050S16960  [mRNA]  locus=s50:1564:20514:- [translate_table: standard]
MPPTAALLLAAAPMAPQPTGSVPPPLTVAGKLGSVRPPATQPSPRNYVSPARVDSFCSQMGGSWPIKRVLVANNGISAVKFIRSVRTWAYEVFGAERAILVVVMATPEDMKANAEHIHMADQFVEVPGGTNNKNYANVQLIVEVAERTKVDAVWPGWGHASENPKLPMQLAAKNIAFMGPPAGAMAALGDKIGSSIVAQAAGVPTLPWSGSRVKVPLSDCMKPIPDDVYRNACVHDEEEAIAACQSIGYPSMMKASWGGGGKGIRKVSSDEEVRGLYKQVVGEVPGSPIFIMKLAAQSRHLEVQLLCDQHNNVAALHSRDCSIQRRHQKIIEEGPITIAPANIITLLEQKACQLARSVGYVGAATVEYLYSMETGDFYFLELNPRLQVEHPVTEWIAAINLPASQLMIAMGIPLWRLPEVRRLFGQEQGGSNSCWQSSSMGSSFTGNCLLPGPKGPKCNHGQVVPFDFQKAVAQKPRGHVIAVRITSEDPDDNFKPTTGRIQELSFRSRPDVWAYFSVKNRPLVMALPALLLHITEVFMRPLLNAPGHLFAMGESRAAAIANMVLALTQLHIRGEIRTIVDYALDLIQLPDFQRNAFHTGWLDARIARRLKVERPPWHLAVIAGSLMMACNEISARLVDYLQYLEKGQVPPKASSLVDVSVVLNLDDMQYKVDVFSRGPTSYRLSLNGSEVEAEAHRLPDGGLLVQLDGNSHVVYAEEELGGTRLLIDGRICLLQNEFDPSKLVAPSPGKLVRLLVANDSEIVASTAFAEMEVMKMTMPLIATAAGRITLCMSEGDLIAMVELDDPSTVRRALPFMSPFPVLGKPIPEHNKSHQKLSLAANRARMVLAGYQHDVQEIVADLQVSLEDDQLASLQWEESFAVHCNQLPKELRDKLEDISGAAAKDGRFPACILKNVMQDSLDDLSDKDRAAQESLLAPLLDLVGLHESGGSQFKTSFIQQLLVEYLTVEEPFSVTKDEAEIIESLRREHKEALSNALKLKNRLVIALLDRFSLPGTFCNELERMAVMQGSAYIEVALKANQLLQAGEHNKLRRVITRKLSAADLDSLDINSTFGTSNDVTNLSKEEQIESLMDESLGHVDDVLAILIAHEEPIVQAAATEAYIRRLYELYLETGSIVIQWHDSSLIATWEFWEENPPLPLEDTSQGTTIPRSRGVKRWGAMVVVLALELIPAAVKHALIAACGEWVLKHLEPVAEKGDSPLKERVAKDGKKHFARQHTFVGVPSGYGNVLHVVARLPTATGNLPASCPLANLRSASGEAKDAELVVGLLEGQGGFVLHHQAGVGVVSCMLQPAADLRQAHFQSEDGRQMSFTADPDMKVCDSDAPHSPQSEQPHKSPLRHCFHWSDTEQRYMEQPLLRHVEPPLANLLELDKLSQFEEIHYERSSDLQWHMYFVVDRASRAQRAFVRALGGLEELEMRSHHVARHPEHAHLFISVLRSVQLWPAALAETVAKLEGLGKELEALHRLRLHRLSVKVVELRLRMKSEGSNDGAWRVLIVNPSGHFPVVEIYREAGRPGCEGAVYSSAPDAPTGSMHLQRLDSPYPLLRPLEQRRVLALRAKTTYCYDFLTLFEAAFRETMTPLHTAADTFSAMELVMAGSGKSGSDLEEIEVSPGCNKLGMVGWSIFLRTADVPQGREMLLIANDITHKWGAFGPKEDAFFLAMAALAGRKGVPLVYIAANSGARVGLAEEVRSCFKVEWVDPENPNSGFQYLYLDEKDYCRWSVSYVSHLLTYPSVFHLFILPSVSLLFEWIGKSVLAEKLTLASGQLRWKIVDIIGEEEGLGVENLSGSGAVASAFAKAYSELPCTLTFVSGRTVGIGAYLARLGVRCIQRVDQPIILTGYAALNKLLGKEVYSSHLQLGGPRIMTASGTVADDYEGVLAILRWLSYVPARTGGPLPVLPSTDPNDRPVEYTPTTSCKPLAAIEGELGADGVWAGGIFDRGSFTQSHTDWAQTVITGRARLGGIPLAVVAVETATVSQTIIADPGQPHTHERVIQRAGQVWFPDSALKTAQAMRDFHREGLPLFVLANWRGFSGGQQDLLEGILQAGSQIVEVLRTYSQPVIVYIPKTGELRGGAWVVLDSKINPSKIEMFADESARGGVLEPEGMVEIKFRRAELVKTMHRLDPTLIALKHKDVQLTSKQESVQQEDVSHLIADRERALLPIYQQVALKFADLHDTPERMLAKGAIQKIVPWRTCRSFFYKHLKQRLANSNDLQSSSPLHVEACTLQWPIRKQQHSYLEKLVKDGLYVLANIPSLPKENDDEFSGPPIPDI